MSFDIFRGSVPGLVPFFSPMIYTRKKRFWDPTKSFKKRFLYGYVASAAAERLVLASILDPASGGGGKGGGVLI